MKMFGLGNRNRTSAGKVITAALVGSVVGATVGWLTAPTSGAEIRRRIKGEALGPEEAHERAKTAAGNVETRARELAAEVTGNRVAERETGSRRRKADVRETGI